MLGTLIARDKATLHELQSYYSYHDALNIYEIIRVQDYNEWVAQENARKK